MSELRFSRPRLRRLGILIAALVVPAFVYACGGNDDVLGPPDELPSTNDGDAGPKPIATSRPQEEAEAPKVLPPSSIALGDDFACVVAKDRSVWCWGKNDVGQLGRDPAATGSCGTFPCSPLPSKVEGLPRIATVKAGKDFACALDDKDQLWCWGNNAKGQIQGRDVTSRFTPELVAERVAQVEAAGEHACVLLVDGAVFCWGDNACPLFGRAGEAVIGSTRVPGLFPQASISLGPDQMCTVALDSSVLCWGTDHKGSLGHPLPSDATQCNGLPFDPTPKRVAATPEGTVLTGAAEVRVGQGIVCLHTTDGVIKCWGDNSHGGLGQGIPDTNEHRVPVDVPQLKTLQLAVAGETACAKVADRLVCWGDGRYGQLENVTDTTCGGTACRPLAHVVPSQNPVREIALSPYAVATIKPDASLWIWGKNDSAETGAPQAETTNVSCAGGSTCIPSPRMLTTAPPLE
ncbi:MAG: hypothetical protein KIT84_36575 [Labilithrix sp.]|nr:hypothetical protein [Labilithrix sp.]MCW5816572.1 hypothetical protein [Labilithrix sp.]